MKKTLRILNQMVKEGVLEDYAIGGAVAAIYYTEPFHTSDLDVFIKFPQSSSLLTLEPISKYLKSLGFSEWIGESILIEDQPVQFLPIAGEHFDEALKQARPVTLLSEPTRLFRLEHLMAIMVQTGRPKDKERLMLCMETDQFDQDLFMACLKKHGLIEKWKTWQEGIDPGKLSI